jgi:hypothetical protein
VGFGSEEERERRSVTGFLDGSSEGYNSRPTAVEYNGTCLYIGCTTDGKNGESN